MEDLRRECQGLREQLSVNGVTTKVTAEDLNWMLMPDGDGEVRLAVLSPMRSPPPPNEVEFVLWTRENPVGGEKGALGPDCSSIRFSTFSPKRRTKVLVHGFGDTGDFNVFAVDWSQLAKAPWYNYAANNTVFAADMTARLLDDLMENSGASPDDFHLIGFSLGAHVVGLTGRFLSERRSGPSAGVVYHCGRTPEARRKPRQFRGGGAHFGRLFGIPTAPGTC
ncbi:hypothetical protein J437_LFUL007028 [Ladona fulva]|uniref:Lipase domain-containing protein n=1 Tax=Ladona fulva TaxID=123851 RepID=A0A8K0K4Q4_LADFU|nr:hypothetical protein J437_LFUL007028 [Ladona fulva]